MRVPGTDGRADKRFALLGRYSSEIRTGCANERPSGSVRGAPGNWCPYRDRQPSVLRVTHQAFSLRTRTDRITLARPTIVMPGHKKMVSMNPKGLPTFVPATMATVPD